jgi:hypothetical protein
MDPDLGEGWTREYAEGIEQGYRNYLTMLAKYQDHAEDILLSKDVDEFWHTHILQTIKYTEDCEAIFGKYLHHAPHIGKVTQADVGKRTALAEKTRRLYEREFGNEQDYGTAWTGTPVKVEAALRAENAAWSGAAIRTENAAWSGAGIRAEKAAWSGAAIRTENAAWSGAAIRTENAAWSGAVVRAENAAWSGAVVRAENAAWSGAAIRPEKAIRMDSPVIRTSDLARAIPA